MTERERLALYENVLARGVNVNFYSGASGWCVRWLDGFQERSLPLMELVRIAEAGEAQTAAMLEWIREAHTLLQIAVRSRNRMLLYEEVQQLLARCPVGRHDAK